MTGGQSALLVAVVLALPGRCTRMDDASVRLPAERPGSAPPPEGPPVALNAESPVTRVAESSGYPGLDSAALAAVPQLHYAPAVRGGTPVATAFLQPIQFRNPQGRR